jgi:hypothetical protein
MIKVSLSLANGVASRSPLQKTLKNLTGCHGQYQFLWLNKTLMSRILARFPAYTLSGMTWYKPSRRPVMRTPCSAQHRE